VVLKIEIAQGVRDVLFLWFKNYFPLHSPREERNAQNYIDEHT
jgi:hypothetical protein